MDTTYRIWPKESGLGSAGQGLDYSFAKAIAGQQRNETGTHPALQTTASSYSSVQLRIAFFFHGDLALLSQSMLFPLGPSIQFSCFGCLRLE
jgi:hypothetical protein